MIRFSLNHFIILLALTLPLHLRASNGQWTSVVLNVNCDSTDTASYCKIKRFEYFPDGTFNYNGVKGGPISRWMQRRIEYPTNFITENDLKKDFSCDHLAGSSPFYESVVIYLSDGSQKIVFVRFQDGRCSLKTEANLFRPLSDAAKERDKIDPHP